MMEIPRLLIVEDDAVNINMLSGLLRNDYQISIARTKKRALEILENEDISLVLLDLNLPDGKGLDICEQFKSDKTRFSPPFMVVMTGYDEENTEVSCFEAGANEFISKPIKKESFLARLALQTQLMKEAKRKEMCLS
ncbi:MULTISPECIES: response regulator [Alteromonadaceae]|uniref:Response regulator n=1 Tax=Brumicola blandensis TaxID=3075611 RepID=A0AAW8QW07_9ALTE|nr:MULTISPECIES: response regulator [unclassified Alteromonas]MDT0581291.1 response regulator [Alteromonas sp. W409]MDT0626919.1 response regulator [Alteromonas sp. W364]